MELFKIFGTIALNGADEANNQLEQTSAKAGGFSDKLKSGIKTIGKWAVAIGSAAVAGGTAATKMAAEFETAMAKVGTIADSSEVPLDKLEKSIVELSNQTGISSSEIAENVYNAISAGQKTGDAVNFVSQATQLAKAGFAESGAALDILSTIMNAYGLEADQVTKVSDNLIMTQNLGKTTVAELSAAMGKAIPTAKSVGVNLDELCGSYAVMTSNGIATAETTTYLNSMLNELGKEGTSAAKAFKKGTEHIKKGGLSMKEAMDKGWGLTDVLAVLDKEAKKSGTSINNLFGSAEAGKAASVLQDNSKKMNEAVKQMGESAGATETAYEKMDDTLSSKMDKMKTNLKNIGITLGQNLLPIVNKVLDVVMNNMPNLQNMIDKLSPVFENLFDIVLPFLIDILPILGELAEQILPLVVDVLSDIIPFIVDIANTILPMLVDLFAQILPILSELFKQILPILVNILGTLLPPLIQIAEAILPVIQAVLDAILPIISTMLEVLKPILDVVCAIIEPIANLASGLINGLAQAFGIVTEKTNPAVEAAQKYAQELANVKQASDDARTAVDNKAIAELNSVQSTEKLWKELQTLCDEQGNVQESDMERAKFITGELSEALGVEFEWSGKQIQHYQTLQEEIGKTIEKKKLEIMFAATEENYKIAIQNTEEAQKNLTEATEAQSKAEQHLQELKAQGKTISDKAYSDALAQAAETQRALVDAKQTYENYYKDIAEYEEAHSLMMQDKTEEAMQVMKLQGANFKAASDLANKSKEEQQRILEEQMVYSAQKYSAQLEIYERNADDCTEYERKTYQNAIKEAKDYFDKAKGEYETAGGKIGQSFFDSLSTKMNENEFKRVGGYIVSGICSGAGENAYQLQSTMRGMMDQAVAAAKSAADIHSPSRRFAKEIGKFIPSGVGMGIEDNEEDAIRPVQDMLDDMASVNGKQIGVSVASNIEGSASGEMASGTQSNAMIAKMDEFIQQIKNLKIYLNGEALVGELTPALDTSLGQIYSDKERGR